MQFVKRNLFARQERETHSISQSQDIQAGASHLRTSGVQIPVNSPAHVSQDAVQGSRQISSVNSVPLPDDIQREEATLNLQSQFTNEVSLDESQKDAARSSVSDASPENLRRHQRLNTSLGTSQSSARTPRNLSPSSQLKWEFEDLRDKQRQIRLIPDGTPRLPTRNDFPHSICVKIVSHEIDEQLEHVIILLHLYTGTEDSLESLAKRLNRRQPNSSYILLRGIEPVNPGNSGYHWADSPSQHDEGFCKTSDTILIDVIKGVLVSRCNFKPRNIMLLGHCQGGMAALAAAASWDETELGGVISIGGPMPAYTRLPADVKAKTPVLIYHSELGDVIPSALQQIKDNFVHVDSATMPGNHETVPESEDELKPLLAFFAHRLEREEWDKQAIISFDGGGIRGLGSLLIVKDLMNKIGDEERKSDREDEHAMSSFAPCDYKPKIDQTPIKPIGRSPTESTQSSKADTVVASPTDGLPYSSLYLPCHYFTYAAGTSTGGLISIMLSRFRMTVDDCIEEYKTLGEKIFGHPRPLASKSAIPWHKFSAKKFEEVIQDVTTRHSERDEFTVSYPSHEDLCRTLVFAYADHVKSDIPFFFRTYWTPTINRRESRLHQEAVRNQGDPPKLPIWEVARATSAAPGYFPQIKIRTGNGERHRFKDGGFGTNNPSREAYRDIVNKHGGYRKKIGLFVSIGTGDTPYDMFDRVDGIWKIPRFWRKTLANFHAATRLPARTLHAHEDVRDIAYQDQKEHFPYFRFEGGDDLGKLALDEWKSYKAAGLRGKSKDSGCITIKKIETAVAVYLQRPEVQKELKRCAELLVRRRRLRTRDPSAWDRYASASYYECALKGCERKIIYTTQEYKEHIEEKHKFRVAETAIQNTIHQSRHCWVYRNQPKATDTPGTTQVS